MRPSLVSRCVRYGSSASAPLCLRTSAKASTRKRSGVMTSTFIASASASLQPYSAAARGFHAAMWPSRSWTMTASLESRTTTARRRSDSLSLSTACACLTSLMLVKVRTAPSITFSSVR